MSTLSPHLPLHDLLRGVISRATEKLAADEKAKEEGKKVDKLLKFEVKEHGHIPSVKEEEAEYGEEKKASANLTSPEYITKLASAVEHIASNAHLITPASDGYLATAIKKMAGVEVPPPVGDPGLRVESPLTGKQAYPKDKAKTHRPETEDGKPLSNAGMPGGATQLHNTMHEPPGAGPNYPAKGPLVNQTKTAGIKGLLARGLLRGSEMAAAHPHAAMGVAGGLAGAGIGAASAEEGHRLRGALGGGAAGAALGAGGSYGAQKLQNSPAIGKFIMTNHPEWAKTAARQRYLATVNEPANKDKTASLARQFILQKLAGEDVLKANISASASASPLVGGSVLAVTDSSQAGPKQPGDPTGGFGNQARTHISSNMAAINAKKGQLKGPVKTQLKEVLDEPALSSATDTILQKNLRSTGEAGVKIAAQRALLQKVASEGTPAQRMKLRQMVKKAMDGTLAQGMAPQAGAAPAGNAPPMASGDEAPDGCTCNQTGECRVCKLKAALSAARGEGQVAPQNPNPQY